MEYPEEIIYKINQFYEEALFNINNIKTVVNYIYQKRIKYIIKSTNIYINNFIKNNINYIKVNINSSYIFDQYYLSKFLELDNLYNDCNKKNDFDADNINISFLDKQSYDDKMKINKDYINDFILFLENITNETFLNEICDDNVGIFYNDTICYKEKKEFNESYSKYNYNIIKLRTGIYYTKTLLENIDSLFDEYNFHDIIKNNKIQIYDELLNDKNIIDIYNKTNHKIREINIKSDIYINETFEYFLEDFKSKYYSFKNDYLPFVQKMEEIIKFENDNYTMKINKSFDEINLGISPLMDELNQTIFYQLLLKENYTYYNFNQTFFKNIYYSYESIIKNIFHKARENITQLNNNHIFHNGIKKILSYLQLNKRKYIRESINNFSKNYDFELLNITYNLGEKIENHLEKEYSDYEFTFIYNYVEFFENFSLNYINYINTTEIKTLQIFENIYNNFYDELEKNSSSFIDIDFIASLKYNQTKCENYKNYTENDYFDKENYIYNNITNNIDNIFINCLNINNGFESDSDYDNSYTDYENNYINYENNYTLSDKIIYISNTINNCSYLLFDSQNNTYYNETLEMIDCFNNNYYKINYTFIYFTNFTDEIEENFANISERINNLIITNRIDENFFYNFLVNQNYTLEPYEGIDLSDLSYDFEDIESMINYVNMITNDEYKNYLYDNLIISFNISYMNFIDYFILDELIDDIIISINNRLEIHLDYMTKKNKR